MPIDDALEQLETDELIEPSEFVESYIEYNISEDEHYLPEGAKLYKGKANNTLKELRLNEIDFYEKTHQCINGGAEYLKDFDVIESTFSSLCGSDEQKSLVKKYFPKDSCNVIINGINYYRGLAVPTQNGAVLIYTPWMQPWIPKQRKEIFQIYTLGNVLDEEVKKIVDVYTSRVSEYIDKNLNLAEVLLT
jgi:hypothetical protein